MANVQIYTKSWCPYCARAKAHLDRKGVSYTELDVTSDPALEAEMVTRSQRRSVPQVFIDGYHIGGSDDLVEADRNGLLDRLLRQVA